MEYSAAVAASGYKLVRCSVGINMYHMDYGATSSTELGMLPTWTIQ